MEAKFVICSYNELTAKLEDYYFSILHALLSPPLSACLVHSSVLLRAPCTEAHGTRSLFQPQYFHVASIHIFLRDQLLNLELWGQLFNFLTFSPSPQQSVLESSLSAMHGTSVLNSWYIYQVFNVVSKNSARHKGWFVYYVTFLTLRTLS